jgi:hypothetical protein
MTPDRPTNDQLDQLIVDVDNLSNKDGSSAALAAIRDSLVGIRDAHRLGEDTEKMERRIGGLFKVVSESEFFGTPMMDRILETVDDVVGE